MKLPQFAAAALAASFAASVVANDQRAQDAQQGTQQQAAAGASQHDADKLRKVQKQLSEKGHNVTTDGVWGPQTEQALKEFQQAQGMQATGELNQQTLAALGIDEGASAATGGTAGSNTTGTSGAAGSSGATTRGESTPR